MHPGKPRASYSDAIRRSFTEFGLRRYSAFKRLKTERENYFSASLAIDVPILRLLQTALDDVPSTSCNSAALIFWSVEQHYGS